jgi:hypothetical protein
MDTPPTIARIKRVDDIPLLLAQLSKMEVAPLLDTHFPMHGNGQGWSLGEVTVGWLSYLISEGDHRLNVVEAWSEGMLLTLQGGLGRSEVRSLDFSDDRLCVILDRLGGGVY